MTRFISTLSALLIVSTAVFAKGNECLTGTVEDQLSCVQADFTNSEVEMNKLYQKIVESLAAKQDFGNEQNFIYENMLSRLRIAQRGWIYYRAGQCELESFSKINKEHIISAQTLCNTKMNEKRTQELRTFFSQYLNKSL